MMAPDPNETIGMVKCTLKGAFDFTDEGGKTVKFLEVLQAMRM